MGTALIEALATRHGFDASPYRDGLLPCCIGRPLTVLMARDRGPIDMLSRHKAWSNETEDNGDWFSLLSSSGLMPRDLQDVTVDEVLARIGFDPKALVAAMSAGVEIETDGDEVVIPGEPRRTIH